MTRFARQSDIPHVVSLARIEHAKSPWSHMPFDETAVAETAARFIVSMGSTLLVTPGGYLAGQVQPTGFSRKLLAIEYAWFAKDGSGLDLLDMFEEWARGMGCAQVVVHDHVSGGRVERVLSRRRGYQSLGGTLARTLEH